MAAMASSYGPFVVNPKRVEENKTADDPWAHEWFLTNADGTGPYKLVENNFTEGLKLEWHDGYWGQMLEGGFQRLRFASCLRTQPGASLPRMARSISPPMT